MTTATQALVCRHCGDLLRPVPGGYVGPGGWDVCADRGTFHEPAEPAPAVNEGDLGPLTRSILDTIRQHAPDTSDQAALQLVYSGAIGAGRRELAVQILVDRHIHRDIAEKIVDEILTAVR